MNFELPENSRWTILDEAPIHDNYRGKLYHCECSCGTKRFIRKRALVSGTSLSCGCYRKEIFTHTTHGLTHHRLYTIWGNIRERCYNPSKTGYEHWGGRGIGVDYEPWRTDFQSFYDWSMANGYADRLTIERNDNNKGYSPDNCRWATRTEQVRNQGMQKNNTSGYKGVYWCNTKKKWKATIGLDYKTISLGYHADISDAIKARKQGEIKYWEATI